MALSGHWATWSAVHAVCGLLLVSCWAALGQDSSPGVCQEIKEEDYNYETLEPGTCNRTKTTNCGGLLLPQPCTKTLMVACNRTVIHTGRRNVTVTTCCDGWILLDDGSCAPPGTILDDDGNILATMPVPDETSQPPGDDSSKLLTLVVVLAVVIVVVLAAAVIAYICYKYRKNRGLVMDRIQLAEKGDNLYSQSPRCSGLQGIDGPQGDVDPDENQEITASNEPQPFVTIEDEMRLSPELAARTSPTENVTFDNSRYSDYHVYANMQFRNGQPLLNGGGNMHRELLVGRRVPMFSSSENSTSRITEEAEANAPESLENSYEHTYNTVGDGNPGKAMDEPDYATADSSEGDNEEAASNDHEYATADQPGYNNGADSQDEPEYATADQLVNTHSAETQDGVFEPDYATADQPEAGSLEGEYDPDYATADDLVGVKIGMKSQSGMDDSDYAVADSPEEQDLETESLGGLSNHSYDSLPDRQPESIKHLSRVSEKTSGADNTEQTESLTGEENIYDRPQSMFIYDDTLSPNKARGVSMFTYDDTVNQDVGFGVIRGDLDDDYDYPDMLNATQNNTGDIQDDYETFDGTQEDPKVAKVPDEDISSNKGTNGNDYKNDDNPELSLEDNYEGIDVDIADKTNLRVSNVSNHGASLKVLDQEDDYEGFDPEIIHEIEGSEPQETYLFHDFHPSETDKTLPNTDGENELLYDDNVVSGTCAKAKSSTDPSEITRPGQIIGDMDDNYETFDQYLADQQVQCGIDKNSEPHRTSQQTSAAQIEDEWEPEDTYVYHDFPIQLGSPGTAKTGSCAESPEQMVPPPRPPKTRFGPVAYKPVPELPYTSQHHDESSRTPVGDAGNKSVDDDEYETFDEIARKVMKFEASEDTSTNNVTPAEVHGTPDANSHSPRGHVPEQEDHQSGSIEVLNGSNGTEDVLYQSIGEDETDNLEDVDNVAECGTHGTRNEKDPSLNVPYESDHPSLEYEDVSGSLDINHDYDVVDSTSDTSNNDNLGNNIPGEDSGDDDYETFAQCLYGGSVKDGHSVHNDPLQDRSDYDYAASIHSSSTIGATSLGAIDGEVKDLRQGSSPVVWDASSLYEDRESNRASYLSNPGEDTIYENLPCRTRTSGQRTESTSSCSHSDFEPIYGNLPCNPVAQLSQPGNRDSGIYEEIGGENGLTVEDEIDETTSGDGENEMQWYDTPNRRSSGSGRGPLTRLQSELDTPVPVAGQIGHQLDSYLPMSSPPNVNQGLDQPDNCYPKKSPDTQGSGSLDIDGSTYLSMSSQTSLVEEEPIYENRDSLLRQKRGRSSKPVTQIYESVHNPPVDIHHQTQESEA